MQQYVSLLSSLAPQWEDAGGSQEGQAGTSKAAGDSQQESRKGGGFGPVFSTFAQEYDADGSQQGSDMDQVLIIAHSTPDVSWQVMCEKINLGTQECRHTAYPFERSLLVYLAAGRTKHT